MPPLYGTGGLPLGKFSASALHLRSAAGATTLATDTFTRADAASLGTTETGSLAWTLDVYPSGTPTGNISSGTAYTTNGTAGNDSFGLLNVGTADHDITITVTTIEAYATVVVRFIDSSNLVLLQKEATAAYGLYRKVTGAYTLMGSTSTVAPASGDVLRVVATGTSYSVYQNGVLRISATDATANTTGTKVGFRAVGTAVTARFDNLSVASA